MLRRRQIRPAPQRHQARPVRRHLAGAGDRAAAADRGRPGAVQHGRAAGPHRPRGRGDHRGRRAAPLLALPPSSRSWCRAARSAKSSPRQHGRYPVSRFIAIYHVRSDARSIEARAQAIAVEQSVEMPLSAIEDQAILDEIVGKVEEIGEIGRGLFAVRIALARATVGDDAGQLINMLFGNTSLQEDVVAARRRVSRRPGARAFGGPQHRARGPARARRRGGPRADLLGAEAAGAAAGPARASSRRGSRAAASTTSRTITGSPIRPIRRSRRAATRSPRRCARSSARPGSAPAMCRA